ncbi:glycosyltransferase family 4 protein [Pedobacter immunditicola]|uniref:glycosyltransferase family 4 protein n=1 Tax=Pedobacter immunditicola TaxID=3133440 RepID=UPI0030A2A098
MLKVIFIGHRDLYFGAESVMLRVIRLLKNKGIAEPLVVLPKSSDDGFSAQCKLMDIKPIKVARYKLIGGSLFRSVLCVIYNTVALLKLGLYFRKKKGNVVYTNTSVNIMGPMLSLFLNLPHLWHFHEQPTPGKYKWIQPGLFPFFRFLINRKNTTVIFISRTQKSLWEKEFGFQIRNSIVVYTPAGKIAEPAASVLPSSAVQFDLGSAAKNSSNILEKETVTFGFLGSWTPSKNLLSLLEAFAKLRTHYPQFKTRMVLMGAGELESELVSQINVLGLQNNVTLLPHSTEVLPFFNQLDVFVLPSWFESWGLAALEAIEQKKALILTSHSGLAEILVEHSDCLYTDPQHEGTLYRAMEYLLLHPDHRIDMANHAYHTLQGLQLDTQFEQAIVSLFKQYEVP